jgi:hypothetical protein
MFKWFKDNEIDRVNLDELDKHGWKLREKSSHAKVWDISFGDVLLLEFRNKRPVMPFLSQTIELRNYFRKNVIESGGGILKVEVIELKGLSAVDCLFKIPMKPTGMLCVGSLVIPFSDKAYYIEVQCREQGMTGVRESLIWLRQGDSANKEDEVQDENFDILRGWMKDPYDESATEGILMNLADDEKYDVEFPDHPLSRARKYMAQIREIISFDNQLFKLDRFS